MRNFYVETPFSTFNQKAKGKGKSAGNSKNENQGKGKNQNMGSGPPPITTKAKTFVDVKDFDMEGKLLGKLTKECSEIFFKSYIHQFVYSLGRNSFSQIGKFQLMNLIIDDLHNQKSVDKQKKAQESFKLDDSFYEPFKQNGGSEMD